MFNPSHTTRVIYVCGRLRLSISRRSHLPSGWNPNGLSPCLNCGSKIKRVPYQGNNSISKCVCRFGIVGQSPRCRSINKTTSTALMKIHQDPTVTRFNLQLVVVQWSAAWWASFLFVCNTYTERETVSEMKGSFEGGSFHPRARSSRKDLKK